MENKSFTLIELLVVISIIGMLASIVLVSVKGARERARDARTVQEVEEIVKAFYLYYDANGKYPVPISTSPRCLGRPGTHRCNCKTKSGEDCAVSKGDDTLNTALSVYISSMPYPASCGMYDSYIYVWTTQEIAWPFKTNAVKCPGAASPVVDDCGRQWCWQSLPK